MIARSLASLVILLAFTFVIMNARTAHAQTDSVFFNSDRKVDSGYVKVQTELQRMREAKHTSRPFFIWIDGGLGYSRDIGALTQPTATPGADYTNGGLTGLLRIRGSRSDFISVGIEGGYQHLSSATQTTSGSSTNAATTITASLNAIPIMGIITLQDYGIELSGSAGFYRLISTATLYGQTITSGEYDMAYALTAAFEFELNPTIKLLPEFRFTRVNDQRRSLLAFMLRVELPRWGVF